MRRGRSRAQITGWMQSDELKRRAAGNGHWLARPRGKGREGWSVEDHNWACSSPEIPGHGLRGTVVGCYLPALVADEGQMKKIGGVRLMVQMKRMAVGRTAGGFERAVGIRCRQERHKHKMSRSQLVGITGQRVQADGGSGVLVEGQQVWEEWTGQTMGDTKWRKKIKGQWRAKEQAAVRRGRKRTWRAKRCLTEVENGQ